MVWLFVQVIAILQYSRVAELAVKSTGEEENIYLQLLFVTVSALVLVVFVVSIIFSCWWLKSQKWEDEAQLTDAGENASKCSEICVYKLTLCFFIPNIIRTTLLWF